MAEDKEVDYLQLGMDVYNYLNSEDAIEDSEADVKQGFQMQNPWSPYQPIMGAGLMQLLADPSSITQTPGYQFAYDQGLQSLFSKQAAAGNRFSGRALTETMQFGQGLAEQIYNSEMDRYAQLAGATNPIQGGITTGENLSQLGQQGSFNKGNFWNNFINGTYFNSNDTSVTDQGVPDVDSSYNTNDPFANAL